MAYGRRRAAARVQAGRYEPHPGWRNFLTPGWRVLTNQAEARRLLEDRIDHQDWRTDKRTAWTAILRKLVYSMDWTTGLISAVTTTRLGAAGDRATRTVSRVLAWAQDTGLLAVVEPGASAAFLATTHGRTPTYAVVTNTPLPAAAGPDEDAAGSPPHDSPPDRPIFTNPQLTKAVEENGDPPTTSVSNKPLNRGRLEPAPPPATPWPVYRIPQTPPERAAATRCLLQRLGLDPRGVPRLPLWRTRALLAPWWDNGACPAGLLHALHHHPDQPHHHRGDTLRGAKDPLRVLGHRLQPWKGRLTELPPTLTGIHGDYPTTQARHVEARTHHPDTDAGSASNPAAGSADVRAAARAALTAHLAQLHTRRGDATRSRPSS